MIQKLALISFTKLCSFIFVSSLLTILLRQSFNLAPVLSAATIACFLSLVFSKFKDVNESVYIGCFIGMANLEDLKTFNVLIVSILASLIYSKTLNIKKGYGGKLGTIAYISSLLILFSLRII